MGRPCTAMEPSESQNARCRSISNSTERRFLNHSLELTQGCFAHAIIIELALVERRMILAFPIYS